jgi:transcriptional regulator with XRE-family HTH domain
MPGMDEVRLGRFVQAARCRLDWRQCDLAERARVSQQEISLIERGHLDGVPIRTLRLVLRALDASVDYDLRWRGGAIDRLLDERHAALVGAAVERLREDGWETRVEITYSRYGERGSIDVLGWRAVEAALAVGEIKSDFTSVEQTLRKHDEKVRLAPAIVREREGWVPRIVGRVLVLPDTRTSRRRLERARSSLTSSYPMGQREVRAWLRHPVGSMGGVLLLPDTSERSTRRRVVIRRRVTGPDSA